MTSPRISPTRLVSIVLVATTISMADGCGRAPSINPPLPPHATVGLNGTEPDSGVRFVDVAAKAGLAYRWTIPGKRPLSILRTIGNGCAFLDYDNDGNLDILLVGPRIGLFRGDGHGRFEDVSAAAGLDGLQGSFLGCAVGDYDNDGYPDIYITAYRGGVLLHNEAAGGSRDPSRRRFRDVTRESGIAPQPWGSSAAFADIDGDGRLDLYIGNYVKFGPDTVPQMCSINGHSTACSPTAYQPERGSLYRNLGGGRFADVTRKWGADRTSGKVLGAAFADLDGSGRQSLVLANDEVAGDLLKNLGSRFENIAAMANTAFSATGKPYAGMGVDWGDCNNDGRLDIAVATYALETKPIFVAQSGGFFDERSLALGIADSAAPYVSFGIKWIDVENDGWLDLMICSGHISDNVAEYDPGRTYREPTMLYRSESGSRLTDIGKEAGPDLSRPIVGRGLAIGDYDNDGLMDALAVDSEGSPLLLHNESRSKNHWIRFSLEGIGSNRDGYGAVLTITAGGRKLMRHCHADGSYMSSSDKRVHFGLGTAARVDILDIRWPSGRHERITGLAADRQYRLVEGRASKSLAGIGENNRLAHSRSVPVSRR